MVTRSVFGAITAAIILNAGVAFAEPDMERCKVVDKNGKNIIKEHKADGTMDASMGAGQNKAGDAGAWINVPKGMCAKINDAVARGDMAALKGMSLPADVMEKLDLMMVR